MNVHEMIQNLEPAKLDELPLGAQVNVLFSMAWSAHSAMEWWSSDERNWTTPESEKNAEMMAEDARKAFESICLKLNSASHFAEGMKANVEHDASYAGEEDIEHHDIVVNAHPYAWAKQRMMEAKIWPESLEGASEKLILWDANKCFNRKAAKILGRWVLELAEYGEIIDRENDGENLMILCLSPGLLDLQKLPSVNKWERLRKFIVKSLGGKLRIYKNQGGEQTFTEYGAADFHTALEALEKQEKNAIKAQKKAERMEALEQRVEEFEEKVEAANEQAEILAVVAMTMEKMASAPPALKKTFIKTLGLSKVMEHATLKAYELE